MSFHSRYCVCTSAGQVSKVPASVFWLCGTQQILTRLRGLRVCRGWSLSLSQCVYVHGLCWSFCCVLRGLFSGSMKTPVLLCILLFSQSWAFEFIIDGEWEDEMVRQKWEKCKFICMRVYVGWSNMYLNWKLYCVILLVRSFGSVPQVWEIQGKFSY